MFHVPCFPICAADAVDGGLLLFVIGEFAQQRHAVCAGNGGGRKVRLLHIGIDHAERRVRERPLPDGQRRFFRIAPALVRFCDVIADLRQDRPADTLHGQPAVTDHLARRLQADRPETEAEHAVPLDTQRGKEMLLCKVQHGLPGHPRQNAGQDVRPDERCVAKFADRPLPAQQIEGEPHPVRAGKILRVGCGAIFVGRGHGEHVPDRDALDRLFAPLGRVFRKKFQDLLVDTSKAAPVQRDPEQDRDDALGHREHVKTAFGRAAAKIAFIDGLAVLPNDHPGDIAVVRRDGRFQFHLCFFISRRLP